MTLGEYNSRQRWLKKWKVFMDFLEKNRRNPSKYDEEERVLWNWCKHNKRLLRAGTLQPDRVDEFKQLLEVVSKYKRINQYAYIDAALNDKPGQAKEGSAEA
jgi:hypothetical protein